MTATQAVKNEALDRVVYAMQTFDVEEYAEGGFFIVNGYYGTVVREGLTAADEPHDICDEMNAREVLKALREPTAEMLVAGAANATIHLDNPPEWYEEEAKDVWQAMIDEVVAVVEEDPE